jgi:GxxExxY protein
LHLRARGIEYDSERRLDVLYKGQYVGENYADLIVGSGSDTVIVELKATPKVLGAPEKRQLRKYMELLGMEKGLLINFPQLQGKKDEPMKPEIVQIPQEE